MNRRVLFVACVAWSSAISGTFAADNDPFGPNGAAPLTVPFKTIIVPDSRSSEDKILEQLACKTELDFADNPSPLKDVIDYIRTKHNIEVVLDQEALKQAGLDPAATLVSKSLKDISLRSALKLILSNWQLTYIIDNEVLLITTKDHANASLKTKIYDIRDLVGVKNGSPDSDAISEIVQLITSTIEPASWKTDIGSGQGSVRSFTKNGICVLIAYQTFDAHEQIAILLDELREHRQVQTPKDESPQPKASTQSTNKPATETRKPAGR